MKTQGTERRFTEVNERIDRRHDYLSDQLDNRPAGESSAGARIVLARSDS
jgi:hypothetical protein